MHRLGSRHSHQIEDRRSHIDWLNQGVGPTRFSSGQVHHLWDMGDLLVERYEAMKPFLDGSLAHPIVLTQVESVIGGENDGGVFKKPHVLQRDHEPAEPSIHQAHFAGVQGPTVI